MGEMGEMGTKGLMGEARCAAEGATIVMRDSKQGEKIAQKP